MSLRSDTLKRLHDAFQDQEDDSAIELESHVIVEPWRNALMYVPELLLRPEPANTEAPPQHDADRLERFQEMIEIRPTIDPPPTGRRPVQTVALLWLFTMANVASNARNPLLPQPWRSLLDAAVVNPNRELGVALSYLFTSDIHDIAERLRLEGRGHAGLGILANIGKILVGNIPVMAYGFGQGMLIKHFENQIEQQPVLRVLASPYVSRIITAILSTVIYTGARKLISYCYPVQHFKFNQTPPLHWLQRIAGFGFRIYDATTSYEFYRISLSQITTLPLHHPHFPLGAPILDQVNVNIIQRLALNYHPYNDSYPFATAEDAVHPDVEPLLDEPADEDDQPKRVMSPSLKAYEESRSNVYSLTHTPARCDNVKVVLWYSGRVAVVLAIAYTANLIGSQLQQDKEELNDQLRMTYTALICLASTSAERIYEDVLPWFLRKISVAASSCWSCLFSSARQQAQQVVEEEENDEELLPPHSATL